MPVYDKFSEKSCESHMIILLDSNYTKHLPNANKEAPHGTFTVPSPKQNFQRIQNYSLDQHFQKTSELLTDSDNLFASSNKT